MNQPCSFSQVLSLCSFRPNRANRVWSASRHAVASLWFSKPITKSSAYPVHLPAGNRHRQRIKCVVLAASRTEPITESDEVLLADTLQHSDHRLLDDLVFQRGDAQRASTSVGFGDVYPQRRLRAAGSSVNSLVKVLDAGLHVLLVFMPWHFVHADCCGLLQVEESGIQTVEMDMMQQSGEP